ncbi:MAG TPA: L,D-transpeptidase family protein, partial [Aggregatilinea sp.]|uniref:L,D-transpeptidase family protein n=1 Tax=Aggregatilinea sp. TaxID=2806333 RepID=UPI002C981575
SNGHRPPAPRRRTARPRVKMLALIGGGLSLALVGLCALALVAGLAVLLGSDRVLPGVSAGGVDVGNLSEARAAETLAAAWNSDGIVIRDGARSWTAAPGEIGIVLDASATAAQAREWGRSEGGMSGLFRALAGGVEVAPVLAIDLNRAADYLDAAKETIDVPAANAGVRLVNGQAQATPASDGRTLDVAQTVRLLQIDAAGELADGALDLVMIPTQPTITDATPLVAQANALLSSPFQVDAYDPIRDEWQHWSAPPDQWAGWLEASSDSSSSTGLVLAMNSAGPTGFLQSSAAFGDERYIDVEDAVADMQAAIAQGQTAATVRVWHHETTYTVQGGQTLASIGEQVGIPYPFIQAANPGINVDALSSGQELVLPSKDILVPMDPIPSKRIVVSRGQQHLWAYENGQVVFDWVISTGLPTSPTALGTFQVQTHDENAYAEQWNLYMPDFMGFYHPGPNMDLWNGFHGFPTRGGGYLLWEGDLGTPVTYGCVLLSLENARTLYNWAEDGVVVEVRGS